MADSCDLTALPFDQYGRHRDAREVAELIRTLEGPARLAVLDVGGYPGLAPRFLPADWVVVADPAAVEGSVPRGAAAYLRASGAALPFHSDSFDLVLSLDSLEHVPPRERPRYLAETAAAFEAGGAVCHAFPSGYLYHWLPLMLLKHHLLSLEPDASLHAAL